MRRVASTRRDYRIRRAIGGGPPVCVYVCIMLIERSLFLFLAPSQFLIFYDL